MIDYRNGNTDQQFITQITEYNHAIRLLQKENISNDVKCKVISNVYNRFCSIYNSLLENDNNWINCVAKDNKDTKYKLNMRQLLANLIILKQQADALNLNNDMSNNVAQMYDNVERQIILEENNLNRTYANKVLRALEVGALVTTLLGCVATGVGLIAYGVGYFTCACEVAAGGAKLAQDGLITTVTSGSIWGGTKLVGNGETQDVRKVEKNDDDPIVDVRNDATSDCSIM